MPFKTMFGIQIDRPAAADPQNVWLPLFTIAGGIVRVFGLIGVRTVIQAAGASTMQFRHSVGTTVLDNGTLAITGDTVGTIYYCTGDLGDVIIRGLGGIYVPTGKQVATAAVYAGEGWIMSAGTLDVRMTAAAGTGSTRYVVWYLPIDIGATIVAT